MILIVKMKENPQGVNPSELHNFKSVKQVEDILEKGIIFSFEKGNTNPYMDLKIKSCLLGGLIVKLSRKKRVVGLYEGKIERSKVIKCFGKWQLKYVMYYLRKFYNQDTILYKSMLIGLKHDTLTYELLGKTNQDNYTIIKISNEFYKLYIGTF